MEGSCRSRLRRERLALVRRLDRGRQGIGPMGTDAAHTLPFARLSGNDGREAPEMGKESASRTRGDSRHGCERCFRSRRARSRLRTLRVRRPVPRRCSPSTFSQAVEPQCRVVNIDRSQQDDAQVRQGETCSPDRGRRERSIVKPISFDQHVREARRRAQSPDLRPEGPRHDRAVHTSNRLPFDQCTAGKLVIPGEEVGDLDHRSTFAQQRGHTTGALMDVSNYLEHHAMLVQGSPVDCQRGVPVSQLALSPGGESA